MRIAECGLRSAASALRGLLRRSATLAFESAIVCTAVCTTACSHPGSPSTRPVTRDVLEFLLGDAGLWPRVGNHGQDQVVDLARREVCWVKYANPKRFECWRWDDQYIYHAVDHALDGDSPESYHLTDGRWLPRYLPAEATRAAPWTLDVTANDLVWYDAACHVDPQRSHPFPYRQRAWIAPGMDAGPDLGRRDTLVLEYEPYDPAAPGVQGIAERFYFGLGAGWYEWEREGTIDRFNRLGGIRVAMARDVWCGAP